ncbi:MAG: glycosyltransferase, partial [Dehalococcoidia bacterium]
PNYQPAECSSLLRDEIEIPRGQKIVLYIGRITFNRGIEELLKSLRYLNGCSVVLMGYRPDNYVADLERFIESEGLTKIVHFFGPVPFKEVPQYAASADVGIVLFRNVGLSYYYSSPNKLFECMAAGLPVVGSNFPDLKMFIEGYNFGVTCDPDNPKDIADAINYILSDESRYNEMRRNALEAAKVFNWENESRKLLALYEGLNR